MKRAKIYINDIFCGVLTEAPDGYHFKYEAEYISVNGIPLSPTMPLHVPNIFRANTRVCPYGGRQYYTTHCRVCATCSYTPYLPHL